jgi:putative membrane protein
MPERIGLTVALKRVWLWSLLMGGYACFAVLKDFPPFSRLPDVPIGIDAVATFAMGMLLVFRTNRAYERWWEARIHWGTLVNVSRNLAIKIRELVHPGQEETNEAYRLIVANCYALMDHLREDIKMETIADFLDDQTMPKHEPAYIVGKIYALLQRWREAGKINDQTLWVLDREVRTFLDVCGACERIKSTLISQSWRLFTRQSIVAYLVVLPWGLYDDFGYWTIPLTVVISYFAIGGEGIAHYIEEPFGQHEDHLNLPEICKKIEMSVAEILQQDVES